MPVRLRLHAAAAVFLVLAAALALTVLGLLTLNGAQAANTQPNCGDTITADTRLDGDLVDCPNNGIVIGADDITLDLNGHRIDGDSTPAAGCNPRKEPCDIGVANDGHDGVTVKRGSLRDFGIGVLRRRRPQQSRARRLLEAERVLRLCVRQRCAKPDPRQLGKRQHRSRGGRNGRLRLP